MKTVNFETWRELKAYLTRFSSLGHRRREQFLFRGQASSEWGLRPTLDRYLDSLFIVESREELAASLQNQFEREAAGLGVPRDLTARQREMLARHHGLPSPLLDWTRSPYVAAYFAFDEVKPSSTGGKISIWIFDRAQLWLTDEQDLLVLDQDLIYSVRVVEQEAAFVRVGGNKQNMESIVDLALTRFDVPAGESEVALKDLAAMRITARTLFRDLDGAARSASRRLSLG